MTYGYDPQLTYDYECTPRFMAEQEMHSRIQNEEYERNLKNDPNN